MAMLKRISMSNLSKEDISKIQSGVQNQVVGRQKFSRSFDDNFPVWPAHNSGKYQIYVPNHQVDGELRLDKANIHRVLDGSTYGTSIRCTQGIEIPELGLDGTCPFDDAAMQSDSWFFEQCESRGIDLRDDDTTVAAARAAINRKKAVSESRSSHIFPIVHLYKENGNTQAKAYWFVASETQWEKMNKAMETFATADDDAPTPAGRLFTFNYGNDDKAEIRDAVRNMTITAMASPLDPAAAAKLDEMTVEWTPEKSMDTVRDAVLYPVAQLADIAEKAIEGMRRQSVALTSGAPKKSIEAGVSGESDVITAEVLSPTDEEFDAGDALAGISID